MRKTSIVLFLSLWGGIAGFAQSSTTLIKGKVVDENGQPIPGVIVKNGDNYSALSDLDGLFELKGSKGDNVTFSYIGYNNQSVTWSNNPNLVVKLSPRGFVSQPEGKVRLLDRTVTKDQLVQSVSYVSGETISQYHGPQTFEALAGRVPGLRVDFNGGDIGGDNAGLSFNLRGSRAKTVLTDGVELGFTSIDPDQIESITVLKDALSTVMMGGKSSNGVIYIETKKGKPGKPRFSFTAEGGFRQAISLPDVLPAWQYAELYNEAYLNDHPGGTAPYSDIQIEMYKKQVSPYLYPDVDWYDTVLNKNATSQRYNFNVSGGGKTFTYFVDFDYMGQGGFFKTRSENKFNTNEQLDRLIIRSNVGAQITKSTHLQVNFIGRSLVFNEPACGKDGLYSTLFNMPQNAFPVYNPDGSIATSNLYGDMANPWGKATYGGHKFNDKRNYAADIVLDQKLDFLLEGLYLNLHGSYNSGTGYTTTRAMNFASYQYDPITGEYNLYGQDSNQTSSGSTGDRTRTIYLKAELGYNHAFGKHLLGVKLRADQRNNLEYHESKLPEIYATYAAGATYSYDNRYLVEAAYSRGGHQWYAPENRWQNYWAAGLSWNAHNEEFMKGVSWISYLKPRLTYGLTGYANPSYYGYIETYTLNNTSRGDWYRFKDIVIQGSFANNVTNPDLHPELARKLNIGLDLGFFNNRLTMTGDYFYNKFTDLNKTPTFTTGIFGANYPTVNYQKFDYWGGDLNVTWQDTYRKFNYYVSTNLSFVQSEVKYIQELAQDYPWQLSTGKPVGVRFGYIADGLFRSPEEIEQCTAFLASAPKSTIVPGDIRYVDRNKDNVIDQYDKGAIGTCKPQGYYGIEAGFNISGFDVNVLFQGTINRELYLSGDFMNGFGNGGKNNAYVYNLGRYTEETAATATQPRLWIGDNTNNTETSTFWQHDADYLRLKNIEIGYTLPYNFTKKFFLPTVRLYASATNLLTFSEIFDVRTDMDPEAWAGGYPMTKSFMFGVNVKF